MLRGFSFVCAAVSMVNCLLQSFHFFRSFGVVSQGYAWNAQDACFFLDTAGVCQEEFCFAFKSEEVYRAHLSLVWLWCMARL